MILRSVSRFAPVSPPEDSVTLYWIRTNSAGSDNAAIQATALDTDYRYISALIINQNYRIYLQLELFVPQQISFFSSVTNQKTVASPGSRHFKYPIITSTN